MSGLVQKLKKKLLYYYLLNVITTSVTRFLFEGPQGNVLYTGNLKLPYHMGLQFTVL